MKKSNRHSDLIISFDADDVNEIYDKKQCQFTAALASCTRTS